MAIRPLCDKCGKELEEFGAVLISPPDGNSIVKKNHICKACYEKMAKELK